MLIIHDTDNKYIYPTAASRTTVTGTFSFLRASAICRLNKEKNTDSVSVCPVRIKLGHSLLTLFTHPAESGCDSVT